MNRLARERSPYLLQHADNPGRLVSVGRRGVRARPRRENKPIFLSIGYSTCHWCHVMEHESFENPAIAEVLNADFVSIKVDREERPDVDRVYMTFVQATTGSGGWPMSVWLTPELKPFFGGTYFPPTSRWGRPGFLDILSELARVWKHDRARVDYAAAELFDRLRSATGADGRRQAESTVAGADALADAVEQFAQTFDRRHGGFGDAPKFPRPSELLFLLREHARTGADAPLTMALRPCARWRSAACAITSAAASIATRSTRDWRVPHFEKMLYDQAQLVLAYLEAAQAAGDRVLSRRSPKTRSPYVRARDERPAAAGSIRPRTPTASCPASRMHKTRRRVLRLGGRRDRRAARATTPRSCGSASASSRTATRRSDPQGEFTGKNLLYTAQSIEDISVRTGRTPTMRSSTRSAAPARCCSTRARSGRARTSTTRCSRRGTA